MTNKEVKLNEYIFNSVLIHLIDNDTKLNDLLEYSLLSKRCFKIFQNLLLSNNKFIMPFDKFIRHIAETTTFSSTTDLSKSLFQLKDIENISVVQIDDTESRKGSYYDVLDYPLITLIKESSKNNFYKRKRNDGNDGGNDNDYGYPYKEEEYSSNDNLLVFKQFLNRYCPNLKRITVLNHQIYLVNEDNDFTYGGFLKYNKLEINWDNGRINLTLNTGQSDDGEEEDDGSNEYIFSFIVISNYKPNKLYIKTKNKLMKNENINDLLNYSSVNSIHFINRPTPLSFIEKLFKFNEYNHINSLYLEINDKIESSSELISSFQGIQLNKSISKLIIKNYKGYQIEYKEKDSKLFEFLQLIKLNKSIMSLGLEVFGIISEQDSNTNLLSPLISMDNLKTLHCNNLNIGLYLNHCNENKNIKKLVVSIYNNYRKMKIGYNYKSIIDQFIKTNNNTSLDTIKFVYYGYGRDYQLESYNELVNEINQLNTTGNLIFIHKNNKQFN